MVTMIRIQQMKIHQLVHRTLCKIEKISEEEIIRSVANSGMPHCCMRLATFYGPEMRSALAPAVF